MLNFGLLKNPSKFERDPVFQHDFADALPSGITYTRAGFAYAMDRDGKTIRYNADTVRTDAWEIQYSVGGGAVQPAVTGSALVEEDRTNNVLHNCDLANAAWTASNMTAVASTPVDYTRHTELTATANNATITQALTAATNGVTTFYLKRVSGSGAVSITDDNFTTETVISVVTADRWRRFSVAGYAGTNPTIGIKLATSGDVIQVKMVQHEVVGTGEIWSTPIYTTSTAATRNADVFLHTGIDSFITQGQGAVVCDITAFQGSPSSTFPIVWSGFDDDDFPGHSVLLLQILGEISARVREANTTTAQLVSAVGLPDFTPAKCAMVYETNRVELVVNGVSRGLKTTSTTIPLGVETAYYGCGEGSGGTTNFLNGWLNSTKYYDQPLTFAELQELTT